MIDIFWRQALPQPPSLITHLVLITSVHNPRVKEAAKLRERRQREKQQRIIIDGARELSRAMAAGVDILEVFACEPLCKSTEARQALELVARSDMEVLEVTPQVFSKLAFGDRAEGLVGVAKMPGRSLDELQLADNPLVAVVEDIEKPGNLGAIVRTADAAGVSAVIASGRGTDLYNPNVIRASLGTVFSLPVCAAEADELLNFLREKRLAIFAARTDATCLYTEVSMAGGSAIVLGSETAGLSGVWACDDVVGIRLPMLGAADSLNVSAAAAVLFYEALRQRSSPLDSAS